MINSITLFYNRVSIKNMPLVLFGILLFNISCSNDDTIVAIAPPNNATSFTAIAGDGIVELNWMAPENAVGYRLTYTPGGLEPIYLRRDVTSKAVVGLANDVEYEFNLESALGENTPFTYSDGVKTSATPEEVKIQSISENFDASCPDGVPNGWISFSNGSNIDWSCADNGGGDYAMQGNGFGGDAPAADWLIIPEIDLPTGSSAELSFDYYARFGDAAGFGLDVRISTDYSGSGDPTLATWTSLDAGVDNGLNSNVYVSSNVSLASYAGSSVYVAFFYSSSGTGGGQTLQARVDNVSVKQPFVAENFDASCPDGLPNGWISFSNGSNIDWSCADNGDGDYAMQGNGFGGDAPAADWLIMPEIDLPLDSSAELSFDYYARFGDAAGFGLDVRISTDYSGSGDPTVATWTSLDAGIDNGLNSNVYVSSNVSLASYAGSNVYIAFFYNSSGTGGGQTLQARVDNTKVK